jgi:hypothetical protein
VTQTKIDIYNHVMPPSYLELVKTHSKEPGMVKRMTSIRALWDMPARVEMLNAFPEVQQIITLAVPSPEMLGGPDNRLTMLESPTKEWPKSAEHGRISSPGLLPHSQ